MLGFRDRDSQLQLCLLHYTNFRSMCQSTAKGVMYGVPKEVHTHTQIASGGTERDDLPKL